MVRLESDGDPDPGFGGGDGIVTMDFGAAVGDYGDVATLSSGRILSAVPTSSGGDEVLGLGRFTSAGMPDPAFGGGDGKRLVSFPKPFEPYAMVVLPSGKFLVSGEYYTTGPDSRFLVARFNPNGSLDATFGGGDGFVTTQFGPSNDGAWRMAIDTHDRIVVDGWAEEGGDATDVFDTAVARYLPNGAPDHDFSGDGKTVVQIQERGDDYGYGLGLQGDKIVAGVHLIGPALQIALIRFLPNGRLDATFGGGDGEVITPPGSGGMSLQDIAIDGSSKIVVLAGTSGPEQFQVARYLPGGKLDNSFGGDGIGELSSFASGGAPEGITVAPNGRIVAVGSSDGEVAIARWLG